jgi:hypothetical protein
MSKSFDDSSGSELDEASSEEINFVRGTIARVKAVAELCEEINTGTRLQDYLFSDEYAEIEFRKILTAQRKKKSDLHAEDFETVCQNAFKRLVSRAIVTGTVAASENELEFLDQLQARLAKVRRKKSNDTIFLYQLPSERRIKNRKYNAEKGIQRLNDLSQQGDATLTKTIDLCTSVLEELRSASFSLISDLRTVEKYDDEKLRLITGLYALAFAIGAFVVVEVGFRLAATNAINEPSEAVSVLRDIRSSLDSLSAMIETGLQAAPQE